MKRIFLFLLSIVCIVSMSSCHEEESLVGPYDGIWMLETSFSYGDIYNPDENDACYLEFTVSKLVKYASLAEKLEEQLSIGYYVENGVLWYDTGTSKYTNKETISLSGNVLRITQSNGNYDDYKKVSSLPTK